VAVRSPKVSDEHRSWRQEIPASVQRLIAGLEMHHSNSEVLDRSPSTIHVEILIYLDSKWFASKSSIIHFSYVLFFVSLCFFFLFYLILQASSCN